MQLLIIPASKQIYLQAIEEGLITTFLEAGANVLSASCGPCLGTGQGIPADGHRVISSANRNFLGRMGNKNAEIYLASPAAVALSAIHGKIQDPRKIKGNRDLPIQEGFIGFCFHRGQCVQKRKWSLELLRLRQSEYRSDVCRKPDLQGSEFRCRRRYFPHLFKDFDPRFAGEVKPGDIILGGENFGCGSSREHPAVGLAHAGVKAVIVKSVNRIFYRSAINQGLAPDGAPEQ